MTSHPVNVLRIVAIGLVALLAQIIIAPNIRVASTVPDLVLIVVIIQAIRFPQAPATIFGFSLGLLFDLISSGPFGLMALILTLLSLVVSSLNKGTFTEHWVVELLLMVVASLFGELLYGVVTALVNPDLNFINSLFYIVLPTTLYDALLGLIILLIIRLLGDRNRGSMRPGARPSHLGRRFQGRLIKPSSAGHKVPGRPINRKLR